jgi:hypothetical protein
MQTLKRFVTSTMLGLGLTFGAVQAHAQDSLDCEYAGSFIVLYSDYTYEVWDVYVC